jgi:hypothetical protein
LPANLAYLYVLGKPDHNGMTLSVTYFGRDFVNFWNGGNLAWQLDAMRLYNVEVYWSWIRQTFHPSINQMVFSYPPNILPLLLLFGALPYGVALLVWHVLGLLAFWLVSFYRSGTTRPWLSLGLMVTNSSVLCNLLFGQLGFFLAGGFVGALRLLPTRPVLAGLLMGLLTFKPQLGPLLILVLLMRREWLAIAVAIVTSLTLAGSSIYLWGLAPWQYYVFATVKIQAGFLENLTGYWAAQMTTPFSIPRLLGLPYMVAMFFQALVAMGVLIGTFKVLRRKDVPWSLQVAVIAFGATLFTPYLLAYDLAIPVAALLYYISDQQAKFSEAEFLVLTALWVLPFAVGITLQSYHLPVISVTVLACYVMLLRRALSSGPQQQAVLA